MTRRGARDGGPARRRPRRWPRLRGRALWMALVAAGVPLLAALLALAYYYIQFSNVIESRLHGERDRVIPRVFARPLSIRVGQAVTPVELVARLNDVGYAERPRAEGPGEFAVDGTAIVFVPRDGAHAGRTVRIAYPTPPPPAKGRAQARPIQPPSRIARIEADGAPVDAVSLDPPMLSGLVTGSRERRRRVPLATIPERVQQAVLAIEDRRFYYHPGIDPIRIVGALVTNLRGERRYLVGASTITQQLARNFFLTEEMITEQQTGQRSFRRKLLEQFMSVILETKATKDEILELYLNEVYLGHRGSFAVHGVAEAARMFFGKDVSNLTLAEAALIAGIIQSPYNHSPFRSLARAAERRGVVLRAMADAGYLDAEAAERAAAEPIEVVARALDNEAPYFVDYLGETLREAFPGLTQREGRLDIYTTLDLNLQRAAQDAVREGLARVDQALSRRRRLGARRAQAALVAVDPRTGEVLALVGGRSYNQSQFNRAVSARRQPGSTFKPFVYLAAFERAAEEGRADLTPATLVWDEPTTWTFDAQEWSPRNYDNEYDGRITLRRALALSRNIPAIKVGEQAGFDRVAALWRKIGVGDTALQGYPSIALGVFELTPLEMAAAYTVFPNGGALQSLGAIARIVSGDREIIPAKAERRTIARAATTYLVTHMMRSVLNEGTGAGARAAGFALDAAGKSGTTNDLRDAWFVGFTPDLLAVVWVGFDDNVPLGLSGTQAALPIWTAFMSNALAGRLDQPFEPPPGVSFVEIDRDTGRLAEPGCPRVTTEAFLAGTEPLEICELHRF
ncbi:MAG: PBP1A family penicillin-binding protein [Acidobacteriota bacterium]